VKLTEHRIQSGLFKWAKLAAAHHPELALLFAIPNGGARDPITGAMLKAEGVKRGVPDLFLPAAAGPFHGLFLEMKTASGRLSPDQQQWQHGLIEQGYACVTAHSLEQAIDTLTRYLTGRLELPAQVVG
jgi:hypothetical protein